MDLDNITISDQTVTETVGPYVTTFYPAIHLANVDNIIVTDNISVTFNESMDTSSITANTSDTTCAGYTFQLSECPSGNCDNTFGTNGCVQMTADPTVTNDNKTFTILPSADLAGVGDKEKFEIKVTTGAKDASGNALNDGLSDNESQYRFETL